MNEILVKLQYIALLKNQLKLHASTLDPGIPMHSHKKKSEKVSKVFNFF